VWDDKNAGIENLTAIRLRERSHSRVEAALADLSVDLLPQRADV
jgi:hypothetical protein